MDPLTVLALAQLDEEYGDITGRLPVRPGREPELAEAVRVQLGMDGHSGSGALLGRRGA
ncbi:hypothetical protein [Isoptericola rhizosphaerae]|uniref:hypothetical protein n=1 Tax=Isoptericola rhizosphaerae TaxID=3377837 RepID=UPI00383B86C6